MDIIKTRRLVLRPVRRGDEPFLVKYMNERMLSRGLLTPPFPYSRKAARQWVEENRKNNRKRKNKKFRAFVIEKDGEPVGSAGLHNISGHRCELGYWIGRPFWGQGIASEAAKALVDYGLNKLGFIRISAGVYPWNKASVRVAQKSGLKKEGHLRKALKKGNRYLDVYIFAKVR
jgi:[ribosomal protein S5]-alanine N-acetyltransferase